MLSTLDGAFNYCAKSFSGTTKVNEHTDVKNSKVACVLGVDSDQLRHSTSHNMLLTVRLILHGPKLRAKG